VDAKSLDTWLSELEQLHPSAIDLGLARCGEVAERLDLLSPSATTITVAGTNGKGSTVAVMEALLCEQGVSCGAFTSPHLIDYNERIRVNGVEVSDDMIVRAFEEIDSARGDISLTYFEFGALAALWVFRELGVAYQLLEVGLGGRLDAVNIVDADVAVVTAIGLDHQEWLGSDVDTIAVEKCGIARLGRPCIVADGAAPDTVMQTLNDIGAQPIKAGTDYQFSEAFFSWQGASPIALCVPDGVIPLNAAAAVAALLSAGLPIDEHSMSSATANVRLRGRREHMACGDVSVVMDVAHNPDAALQLHEFLQTLPQVDQTIAVFAVMSDKDCRDMISALESDVDFWCLPNGMGGERGQDPVRLSDYLGENSRVFETFDESLACALDRLNGAGRLLVFGSFFTVAAGIDALRVRASGTKGEVDV
jgi:dihydrofolate synthase/folylpolyglutamate synthase